MAKYILKRLLTSVPVLIGTSIIIFLLATAMPGDAVLAMISDESPMSEDLIKIRQGNLGLDQPLPVQYMRWVSQVARGQLGYSYISGRPISSMILDRVPATIELMGVSLFFSITLGVSFGIVSALRQYSIFDYLVTVIGFIGLSVPVFFLGMVLIYVFSLRLGWFPTSGMGIAGNDFDLMTNLRHLFLPALSLGLVRMAMFMRYTRSSMLEVIHADYIRTARAKGLPPRTVFTRHALRNALIPVITIIGITLPVLFSGAIIVETVFQWPGIGMMYIQAVNQRDIPVLMGIATITAVLVVVSNLLTDLAYAFVDPRIRYS